MTPRENQLLVQSVAEAASIHHKLKAFRTDWDAFESFVERAREINAIGLAITRTTDPNERLALEKKFIEKAEQL